LDEDGTKKIYAIFKDANGNTSLIYEEDAENTQNIVFNANGGFGVPENIDTTRVHGMSYILPTDAPYKRGYTFLGWSTDSKATVPSYREGDAVPPDASLGTEDETTLYAIYGTDLSTFPDLVDVVEVGDYVNYPVYYDNPVPHAFYKNEPTVGSDAILHGWRVLSKDKENGIVKLVSAGVPLSFYFGSSEATVIANKLASTTEFLNIDFAYRTSGYFDTNGFSTYNSLVDAFTNKYTVINSDIPEVRSMTKDDVDNLYQYFNNTTKTPAYAEMLNDIKYKDMLAIPGSLSHSPYYLATVYAYDSKLYNVGLDLYSHENHMLGVRPVVTLRPDVKAIGQNINGAWDIGLEGKVVQKPTINKVTYTGDEQEINLSYDSNLIELSGTISATLPGTYTAIASLKDTSKYTWVDGTTEPKEIEWEMVSEMYATLYTDGTLGFSNNTDTIEGKTVSKSYGDIAKSHYKEFNDGTNYYSDSPWFYDRLSITKVEFVNKCIPYESTAFWFYFCHNLNSITNLNYLNTSMVTEMNHMFCECRSLTDLDVSNFDTRNVTDMNHMFNGCSSLTSLNLSNFDTRNVTNMQAMFANLTSIISLDLSNFNTNNVTNMIQMFYGANTLTKIYVGPNWTTSAADITNMFEKCGTSTVTKIQ
ncbi:MAG: BspA family leucine-rich repeat surface protein, partial [Clostridia bacterium]|nr:BspA family leucine-rich repeat surface protein [Clostridia bacterium]